MIPMLLSFTAYAAEITVYGPDTDEAAARELSAEIGVSGDDVQLLWEALRATAPRLHGGETTACAAPIDQPDAEFATRIQRAEGAVQFREYEKAAEHLDGAESLMPCLRELIDRAAGARLFVLRGVVAFATDDLPTASAAFQRAHTFSPRLTWDPSLPQEPLALFSKAAVDVYTPSPSRIYVSPDRADSWWLDGSTPLRSDGFFAVPAGDRLLQYGHDPLNVGSTAVRLAQGEVQLSLPQLASAEWAADPAHQGALSAALAHRFEEGAAVHVVTGGKVWRTRLGDPAWEEILMTTRIQRKRRTGLAIAGSGGVVLAGGLAWSALATTRVLSAQGAARAANTAGDAKTFEDSSAEHDAARFALGLAVGVSALGAATVGTGIVVGNRGAARVRAQMTASGLGVRIDR